MKLLIDQPLGRMRYLMAAVALLATQWLCQSLLLALAGGGAPALQTLPFIYGTPQYLAAGNLALVGILTLALVFAWLLTILSLRRARNADLPPWMAVLCLVPLLQLLVVLMLSAARTEVPAPPEVSPPKAANRRWRNAAEAALAGLALSLLTMLVGVLASGRYEYGVFVLAPAFTGVSAGYLVNRHGDEGARHTSAVIVAASLLTMGMLMSLALEGAICIAMAVPLAVPLALIGGVIGRGIALAFVRRRSTIISGFVILPLFLAVTSGGEEPVIFEMQTTVEIKASPRAIWDALVQMSTIEERPGLPFRLGVAYPVRGVTFGEGVGAVRHGVFSTGIAVESVTEWVPDRRLAFRVLSEPPSMRELSPYDAVNAPHLHGYFTTEGGTFTIEPAGCNLTRFTELTRHGLRMEPLEYWLPFARWIVKENHERVLRHITRKVVAATAAAPDHSCQQPEGTVNAAPR